ncbi:binding-protein-dependent transport systems inner membrane component [Caldicellulosiruptor hydrothermalis 108]|uniref:Binding-protein-dependent transport systems inner membrane component n=2 Tax=Caldicellulosiruptor TaxID=44000 RepID=E4QC49_CALH1|nr:MULTISPECIES: ABC transporter permease subunit [Caldicellulosiruptor]ADQ07341.1 binding-protein-dependent transport systems inner membrane component [Caldicellulosiruptor hydrothermalis 108]BCS81438.1 sugar ABC transporter permease [Caldicellulosiruptor diazotrophicus]
MSDTTIPTKGAFEIKQKKKRIALKEFKNSLGLYILLLPTLIYVIVFLYIPMYGVIIAFKDYNPLIGIIKSKWVGLKYFYDFITAYNFGQLLFNTLTLSVYGFIVGFPLTIAFALLLHYLPNKPLQKVVQNVTFAPHFISTVVMVGILQVFLTDQTGIVNLLLKKIGLESINFLGSAALFKHVYVWSDIWQHIGWNAIIYLAALTNVDPELHEAAIIDGATKLQRIKYIDLPAIMPTVITLLLLGIGNIMSVGFEKAYLMQNNLNIESSEIIATYVYKLGLIGAQWSFSTAVGLFNSVINFVLLISANIISKKTLGHGIW